jgi:anti-anti-sigma regulatory factor
MVRELLRLAFLGVVLMVLLEKRIHRASTLRVVVDNDRVLLHLCRLAAEWARSEPRPERIVVDLSRLGKLEESSTVFLEAACRCWRRSGARVTVRGCRKEVRRAIERRGSSELAAVLSPRLVRARRGSCAGTAGAGGPGRAR